MKNLINVSLRLFGAISVGIMLITGCNSKDKTSKEANLNVILLTKDLTISVDTEEVLAGTFAGLAVNDEGNIHAADIKLQKIVIFSSDGNYLGSVGQKGKGPGEFTNLNPQIRIQSDTLYALQNNARRIDLFNLKTEQPIRTISIPDIKIDNTPIETPRNIFPLSNGNILIVFVNPYYFAPKKQKPSHMLTISKLDYKGQFVDKTVIQLPVPYPTNQKLVHLQSGSISVFEVLFYPAIKIAMDTSDYLYIGKSDSLKIKKYNKYGEFVNEVKGYPQLATLTTANIDSLVQNKGTNFMKAVNHVELPSHWPAFQSFLIDEDGRLWVQLMEPGNVKQTWWVFDKSSNPKWKLTLPAEVELYEIRQNKAYGIIKSHKGFASIVRYHINY